MSGAGPKGGAQGNDKGPGERRFIFAFLASVDRFLPFSVFSSPTLIRQSYFGLSLSSPSPTDLNHPLNAWVRLPRSFSDAVT